MYKAICLAVPLLVGVVAPTVACDLRESYVARLGAADHFNSNGDRLTSAAAVIRQDRANFYVFNKRDPQDQGDTFFASKENRATLEQQLESGQSTPAVLAEILNGTPLVQVSVCLGGSRDYINVAVINDTAPCNLRESYVARLGAADHFNSSGERLTSAAAIIRQDRANYHSIGKRDTEDQDDFFFASKENRAVLERMLENGQSSPGALVEIVNGTPLVLVGICQGDGLDFVNVTFISK